MRSDEVLIPPAWVQIAAILARADEAECSVIRDIADVSDASLSKHLSGKQWRIGGISRFMSNGDHSANDPIADGGKFIHSSEKLPIGERKSDGQLVC